MAQIFRALLNFKFRITKIHTMQESAKNLGQTVTLSIFNISYMDWQWPGQREENFSQNLSNRTLVIVSIKKNNTQWLCALEIPTLYLSVTHLRTIQSNFSILSQLNQGQRDKCFQYFSAEISHRPFYWKRKITFKSLISVFSQ